MRKLLTGVAFWVACAPVALAAEVTDFTLENGLQVVVIEDHRAPVAVQMLWYRIGAADEPPGHSGIAHFFEHLMFKATDDLAAGEFSATVQAQGGNDNAFTSWDYTAYYERVAADRLDLPRGRPAGSSPVAGLERLFGLSQHGAGAAPAPSGQCGGPDRTPDPERDGFPGRLRGPEIPIGAG